MGAVSLPVVIWAAHFTIIYGFTAFACAREIPSLVPWVVGAASGAAVVALLALAVPAVMRVARSSRFPDFLAVGLGGLAMIGVVWEAISIFWIAPCG